MNKFLCTVCILFLVRATNTTAQVQIEFDCKPFAGEEVSIHFQPATINETVLIEKIELDQHGNIPAGQEVELHEGLYLIEFPHQIKIPAAFDAGESPQIVYNGKEIKINNSKANDLFTQFETERKHHFNKTVKPLRERAKQAEDQQDTALAAELSRQEQKAYIKHKNHLITYGYQNMQGSYAAMAVLKRRQSGQHLRELELLIQSVQAEYPKNEQVQAALKEIKVLQNTLVGAQAPDFTTLDENGEEKELRELMGEKGTLIEFWASWCMPCRRMTPELNQIIENYSERGIAFILISLDKKEESWRKAVEKDKMQGIQLCDFSGFDSEPVKNYGITSIPAGFLLDADGKITGKDLKGDELRIKLEELVKQEE